MTTWLWVSLACNLVLAIAWFLTLGWGATYQQANKHLQRRIAVLTDPDPTCGCGHHYSFHDKEDGCHYTVVHYKDAWNGRRGVLTTCPCVRYVGPQPLPKVIPLDTSWDEGDDPA
jgi:hypothetical protein